MMNSYIFNPTDWDLYRMKQKRILNDAIFVDAHNNFNLYHHAGNDLGSFVASWKAASAAGIQYKLPDTIENLWRNVYISPVEYK